ncbi:N-methyl-L-tryptophan oxidase [Alteribacillus sp. YIM 98480]|uniref:N-methyl-L-tryptophan oxidase n=1 Tax=Alteribacillus sp. YIM 98480 TaxID=2606599 RepID=UPI00131C754C|nr:N-methyl-L-tryptophan oxidase [Alteribacillus sp. YIM 98480]
MMKIEKEGHYDVIIVGAGSMGTAAGYFLTKQHQRVLMIDQYAVPNRYGSHHGETRMLRFGYGQGEKYVTLVKAAYELWMELEKQTNKKLFYNTGALMVGAEDSEFVEESVNSSIKHHLPYIKLSAEEIMKRWPGMQIPDDYIGCYDPLSGFLLSEECVLAYKELAVENGADIIENQKVQHLDIGENKVKVHTKTGTFTASKLVITAGAWLSSMVEDLNIPFHVKRKVFGWFIPNEGDRYAYEHFPSVVFDTNKYGHFYGFPDFKGKGVKVGRHDQGELCEADTVNRSFGAYQEDEAYLRNFLGSFLPEANGELREGQVCMYSNTPDSDFVIDFHPEHDNVVLAGGFSGHGFKFASVVGSILADLVTKEKTSHDISFFNLERLKGINVIN